MKFNLDDVEKEYLDKCIAYVSKKIEKHNKHMDFSTYMQCALYDSNIGYYLSGRHKIGKDGDFITAPEVSPLFARCVASACKSPLKSIKHASFMEIGAGLGTFAADFFLELKNLKIGIDKYYILELSADLRHMQQLHLQKSLPEFYHCFEWINKLPKGDFSGIIFANEVIDAMPVSLFKKSDDKIKSITVTLEGEKLSLAQADASIELELAIQKIENEIGEFSNGYTSEINLWVKPWIESLYASMNVGAVILCDYGYHRKEYYHPDRKMGTLQCYYKHQVHDDPLLLPGLQDITAHVDFTNVAEAADAAGFDIAGYTTQALFLLENNLDALVWEEYKNPTATDQLKVSRALRTLTMPDGMGETFKVMALSKNYDGDITGFDQHDFTYLL